MSDTVLRRLFLVAILGLAGCADGPPPDTGWASNPAHDPFNGATPYRSPGESSPDSSPNWQGTPQSRQ